MTAVDYTITHPAPGYDKPLDYPGYSLPSALNAGYGQEQEAALPALTIREFEMLRIMNAITDKPQWYKKVFDESITKKWKGEILEGATTQVSERIVEYCFKELQHRAQKFEKNPDGPLFVYNGNVYKSDTAVSETTKLALQQLVKPLEDVPDRVKDWHPGSDGKVLDLVHPSLFPLVYGKSKVLPIGAKTATLDDCIKRCGEGETIPVPQPPAEPRYRPYWAEENTEPYSHKFQWLPAEVDISGDKAKFLSYINNLHPHKHQELYGVIEEVVTAAIPLWNATLAPFSKDDYFYYPTRIDYEDVDYDPDPENGPATDGPQQLPGEDTYDYYDRRRRWYEDTRRVVQPEPKEFDPTVVDCFDKLEFSLKDLCGQDGRPLQVIVKLANIELTPEKPEYEGGTWHIEGQLNEHICATALYYYSSDNITTSSLSFRQQSSTDTIEEVSYPQDVSDWLNDVYGCERDGPAVQTVGSVETREGRLLTFPNILQHQVQPFKLADTTKPGHRKILALFLVDPHIRTLSTANIPPQQLTWWRDETIAGPHGVKPEGLDKLPLELQDQVFDRVEDFPLSLEEAKKLREELMEERKKFVISNNTAIEAYTISLCEH